MREITVALAGNPNSGKTTIFNNLTGSHQRVGNYPGVTVEVKEGFCRHGGYRIKVVDLPGTYSLSAYSMEEITARDFLLRQRPDVVVDIVDGSNLERNLYLTVQLKEMKVPLVVALNMADEMKSAGIAVDRKTMGRYLGAAVVPTVGSHNRGTRKLIEKIIDRFEQGVAPPDTPEVNYGAEIEMEIEKIAQTIAPSASADETNGGSSAQRSTPGPIPVPWLALKLLENDVGILQFIDEKQPREPVLARQQLSRQRLFRIFGEDVEFIIAEKRYGYVHGLCRSVVRRAVRARVNFSDQADKILTNRLLGLPIFAGMMYLTFWLVFSLGEHPMRWIEYGMVRLADLVSGWPIWAGAGGLKSLIVDGVIGGVGGVLVFVPNIILLFAAITILEDTGYMARAAFLMDRLMKWVGLHGKSFIPMLIGFGCTVPAIMGARILDNRRDRLTTILVLPLMSCGARLPIYMLIIPAFFQPQHAAAVMYSIYIIGIALAVVCARLLRSTLFRGEASPFVMELPPYRMPTGRAIIIHVWQRAWLYLKKAGTVILGISIVMWAFTSYPKLSAHDLERWPPSERAEQQLRHSITGRIGRAMEPALKPLGFDWRIGTSLVGAFAAKEVFVAQMSIVYAVGRDDEPSAALREKLRRHYQPLVGFCIMLFCLIAAPCVATVAITRREAGGWKWALFQFGGLTIMAYILTLLVYQIGSLLHIGVG